LATIFPKNVGGGGVKKVFPDIQKKRQKNFSGHKPVQLRVKNFFPDKFLLKHA
jgi:hypothetical protein